LRGLRRSPGFTALGMITLALGVGAATAVFALAQSVLWQPLPFAHAEQLVVIYASARRAGAMSEEEQKALEERHPGMTGLAFFRYPESASLASPAGADRVLGCTVSANLFDVMEVRAALGRTFLPGEDAGAAPRRRGVAGKLPPPIPLEWRGVRAAEQGRGGGRAQPGGGGTVAAGH